MGSSKFYDRSHDGLCVPINNEVIAISRISFNLAILLLACRAWPRWHMAAVIGRTEIHMKRTGSTTTVPDNAVAKLMYYFDCVCSCVEADIKWLSDRPLASYKNYYRLTNEEEAKLLLLCLALSPDKLIGSIFFPANDEDLDGSSNEFYELSAVKTSLVVSESLLIGGQQKQVRKIMKFKTSWYYLNPLLSFQRSQRPALPSSRPRPLPPRRNSSSCVILWK